MIRALLGTVLFLSPALATTAQQPVPEAPQPPKVEQPQPVDQGLQVEQLQIEQLQEQNRLLLQQIEQLRDRLSRHGEVPDPATPSPQMRQALQQSAPQASPVLPVVTLKAKVIAPGQAIAQMIIGEQEILAREGREFSLWQGLGTATTVRVKTVSEDVVELEFVELEQTISIY